MERLYIELEDVIKDNIQKGNEQLLTMEQFSDFLNQNVRLKEEIKQLEQEKMKLDEQYSKVLKENVALRKNDEEYDKNLGCVHGGFLCDQYICRRLVCWCYSDSSK